MEAVLAGAAQGGSLVQAGVFEDRPQRRVSQELRALAVLASPPGSQPWQSRAEAGRCADCDVSVDSCLLLLAVSPSHAASLSACLTTDWAACSWLEVRPGLTWPGF